LELREADLAPQQPSRNKRAWPASPEPQTSWPSARPEEIIWTLWSPATPIAGGYLTDAWHKYDSIRLLYQASPAVARTELPILSAATLNDKWHPGGP